MSATQHNICSLFQCLAVATLLPHSTLAAVMHPQACLDKVSAGSGYAWVWAVVVAVGHTLVWVVVVTAGVVCTCFFLLATSTAGCHSGALEVFGAPGTQTQRRPVLTVPYVSTVALLPLANSRHLPHTRLLFGQGGGVPHTTHDTHDTHGTAVVSLRSDGWLFRPWF